MSYYEPETTGQPERVQKIPISDLKPFRNHPFRVVDDESMLRTTESISMFGVLTPLLARPLSDGSLEIISGHRRARAAEAAGLTEVPVIVRNMTDDEAVVLIHQQEPKLLHVLILQYRMHVVIDTCSRP